MLQYIHERYANISFYVFLIIKNMAFTISKTETAVNINDEDKGRVWKQLALTFLASIPFFTHGMEANALTSSEHAGHFVSPVAKDGVPWTTTGMIIAAALSAPLYCYFVDRHGRKYSVYVITLVQGASCIPLFLPRTEYSSIILHVLAGLTSGGLFTVLPAYIRELSNDSVRGMTVSLMAVMTSLGYMAHLFFDEEVVMFLMVGLIIIQFLAMIVIPESPSYLVIRGKFEAARSNVALLKCLNEDDVFVSTTVDKLKDESQRAKENGGSTFIGILKNRIYLDILKIGVTLQTTLVLCGSIVFLDQEKSLEQLKMALDPEKTLIVTSMFAGSLVCCILIQFVERKYLLTMGFMGMALSTGVLAVYTQAYLTVDSHRVVPVIALGVVVVAFGVAWALPTVILVEMLNLEIRATVLGIIYIYSQIIKLIHVHTFQYIEDYVGIYTLLYMFAGANLFGLVYTLFAVPDIRNKSVIQIEKQMKRIPLLHFKTAVEI